MNSFQIKNLTGILEEVKAERLRQFAEFGYQDIPPAQYSIILSEEVGEVNKEIVDTHFWELDPTKAEHLRTELIQVAAVALQCVERIDDKVRAHKRDLRHIHPATGTIIQPLR